MAQLKDLIVTGPSRFLNDLYALTIYEGGVKLEDKYYLASNPSGYTSNAGTVTSVAASGSGGISISGSPITSSGTLSIGLDLSTAINGLTTGGSPSQAGDFLVSQYAGASQTSYHRRPVYLVAQGVLGYTTSGKNYAIQMDSSSHKLYVNVPWDNTTYTASYPLSISSNQISLSYDSTLQLVSNKLSVKNPVPTGTANGQVLRWDQSESTAPYWDTPTWITGSGTSGYLAKWNGTNSITNAAQYDTSASNSTIVQRSSNGYVYATYFNTTVGQFNPSSYTSSSVAFIDQDGWLRKSSKSTFINWINPDIQPYEAMLQWGGKNFSGSYGPIDAAMIGTLGANRFELLRPGTAEDPGIEVFYSRDAGSTWIDYGLSDKQKRNIFNSTAGTVVTIGKRATSDTKSVDDRAKIVIHTGVASVYTVLNKFALYVNTAGSNNCWVTIDKCIQNKDYSVESNWVNVVTKVPISGWSGWNIINTSEIRTYGNTPGSQYGHLRFIFGADTAGSTSYYGLSAQVIAGFGGVGWTTPSWLAKYNHAYIWNYVGDVTFQAGLAAYGSITADARNGTASTTGITYLIAGNGTASGTSDNSRGILRLYGTGSGYADIFYVGSGSTANAYSLAAYSTSQYIASVNGSGVTSGTLAKFDSATGHLVSLANGNNGQILAIVNGALTWSGDINALLPSYSSSDRGKFLVVSEGDGSPAWETLYWSDISSTPTTLGEYGITDAKIQNGTITLGSNSITPVTGSSLTANEFIVGNGNSAIKTATVATIRTKLGLKQLAFVEATSSNVGKYLKAVDDGDAVDYEWATPPTGMSNPMTAANDIIVGGTSGAATRLGKGSNGTFLGINSSGNVAWVDNPVPFHGDYDGDVFLWNGTTETPEWVTPPWLEKLIFNAGEIIIGSSNGDPMALSKGSTGQVLTTTSSGNQVAWSNATVRMNANTGSTALSVLLAPSDVSNGASKEAQYANTQDKQLKFTPSTGNLSGVAQINGSTVPSSPKFTDTLADYITEWYNEYSDEPTGIVKYAYDHTPALYLGTIGFSEMSHMWSSSPGVGNPMLTVTNTTSQYNDNWLTGWNFRAPNMTTAPSLPTNQSMAYANFAAINLGKSNSQGEFTEGNSGSIVFHYEGDNSNYNWISFGLHSKDHILQMRGDKTVRTRGLIYMNCDDTSTGGDGHLVASQDWALSTFVQKCLIKGTKILMADGTEKNIENVTRGDEVKSMDINSGKMTTAIVISCKKTGIEHEYTTHLFDNGSYVVTYGPHSVYNKTLGHPTDISKFRIGDETYDADGNVITYAGNMRYYDRSTDVAHYDINTSNNLYFANGILNGKNVFAKYRCMRREDMDIPSAIQSVLDRQETANKPNIGYETDPNYFRAIAAKLKEKSTITKRIEEAKQKLADSDYLVAKFTEGLISAVDWLKTKAERSNWRTAINNDEPLLEAADNAIKAIKAKYQTDDSSVKDRFELFSAWDNAALEYYREWLVPLKPSAGKPVFTQEELEAYLAEEEAKSKNQDLT